MNSPPRPGTKLDLEGFLVQSLSQNLLLKKFWLNDSLQVQFCPSRSVKVSSYIYSVGIQLNYPHNRGIFAASG